MICDRVLGNLHDGSFAAGGREIDQLQLEWGQCNRRFLRTSTRGGRDVGVLLPVGERLRHGDVLHACASFIITVNVSLTDVFLVSRTDGDADAWHRLIYTLGGMHCPAEVSSGLIIVAADDRMEATLHRLGFAFTLDRRRFEPLDGEPATPWHARIAALG